MKTFSLIVKLITALAAVVGFIYVCATYGDKIVAWAKEMLAKCPCKDVTCAEDFVEADETVEAAEEVCAEEAPAENAPVEEAPAEEIPEIDASVPVADEADFEN